MVTEAGLDIKETAFVRTHARPRGLRFNGLFPLLSRRPNANVPHHRRSRQLDLPRRGTTPAGSAFNARIFPHAGQAGLDDRGVLAALIDIAGQAHRARGTVSGFAAAAASAGLGSVSRVRGQVHSRGRLNSCHGLLGRRRVSCARRLHLLRVGVAGRSEQGSRADYS